MVDRAAQADRMRGRLAHCTSEHCCSGERRTRCVGRVVALAVPQPFSHSCAMCTAESWVWVAMMKSLSDGREMSRPKKSIKSPVCPAPRLGSQARARDAGSWPTPHPPEQQQASALGAKRRRRMD
jgi:hypothetical protein